MEVREFEEFIEQRRNSLKDQLDYGRDLEEIRNWVVRQFRHCYSDFEEQTLVENLAEVFQDWLREMAA